MDSAPEIPPYKLIQIICSDSQTIEADQAVVEQSPVLKSLLDEKLCDSHPISVKCNSTIMGIIIACLQIQANEQPIAQQKFYQVSREKIRHLIMVIDSNTGKPLKRLAKKEILQQLFSTAHHLNLPFIFMASACIAVRDNFFKESDLDPDMWRKVQQAKDFQGNDFGFTDINSSQIVEYTRQDLIEWGILPACHDPEADRTLCGMGYIDYLAAETDLLSLEELSESLECWPQSFSEYIKGKSIPIMQIKLMRDEKFQELQNMLDWLVAKHFIKEARKAYALLADYVKDLSKSHIEDLFTRHPKDFDSAFKTALDITYAKKFMCNLSLPFIQLINNPTYYPNLSILLSLPIAKFPTNWNILFPENLTTGCLLQDSLFTQQKLKYLLPLLEPMLGPVIGLNLSGRALATIPSEICLLPHLKVLILADNNLADLPDTLTFLQDIIYLDVSSNLFQIAPDSIFELGKLTKLCIHNNIINVLSTGISQLPNLKKLYLDKDTIIPGNSITQKNLQIKLWDELSGCWFKKEQ